MSGKKLAAFGAKDKTPGTINIAGFALGCVALFQATTVPEPASIALMQTGLLGAAGTVRRRRG